MANRRKSTSLAVLQNPVAALIINTLIQNTKPVFDKQTTYMPIAYLRQVLPLKNIYAKSGNTEEEFNHFIKWAITIGYIDVLIYENKQYITVGKKLTQKEKDAIFQMTRNSIPSEPQSLIPD